jgi:hypothetical protein
MKKTLIDAVQFLDWTAFLISSGLGEYSSVGERVLKVFVVNRFPGTFTITSLRPLFVILPLAIRK